MRPVQCLHCIEGAAITRVFVTLPSGNERATDFVSCGVCKTVYYWPTTERVGEIKGGFPGAYMAGMKATGEMTPEERASIEEAKKRARRNRPRR